VLVGDIEAFFDINGCAEFREAHNLRCFGGGDDDLTPRKRERDHDRALLAACEVPSRFVYDLGRGRRALERREETLLARSVPRAFFEPGGNDDRAALANDGIASYIGAILCPR